MNESEMKGKLDDPIEGVNARHLHDQVDVFSSKLARCWRKFKKVKRTTAYLAKAYDELNINEKSVKSVSPVPLILLNRSSSVILTMKDLLDRLEFRYKLSRSGGGSAASYGSDNIDHLLKRVKSPMKRDPSKKSVSREQHKDIPSRMSAASSSPLLLSRYQPRIVLFAYMIVADPDGVLSGQGESEAALVKSSENFVKEFDPLITILLDRSPQISNEQSGQALRARKTFRSQLAAFDSAWCSFLNIFVVRNADDPQPLEDDMVRAACFLEFSMLQMCKMTSEGEGDDMKAIQRKVSDIKEAVKHLSGDAGIERLENALSDARMKFLYPKESGNDITPSTKLTSSSLPTSSSTFVSSDKESDKPVDSHKKQNFVVRSIFKDEIKQKEVNDPMSTIEKARIVNEYVHGEHLLISSSDRRLHNGIVEKIKETMEKANWEGIIDSVRGDEPDYTRVVGLMKEVKDGIYSMAPFSWRRKITKTIDLGHLTELLNSAKLDIDYLGKILEYALRTLRKLFGRPPYDKELKKKQRRFYEDQVERARGTSFEEHALFKLQKLSARTAYEEELIAKHQKFMKYLADMAACGCSDKSQVIALIEGLRYVLEQIQELQQQLSKARIRSLEPFLNGPVALDFLGKAFSDSHGHPCAARISLRVCAKWLSSTLEAKEEEWNEHKNLLSGLDSSSTSLPSIKLRTGGAKLRGRNQVDPSSSFSNPTSYIEAVDPHLECRGEEIDLLVRLGLLKLVRKKAGLTKVELPETMNFNLFRLERVQSDIQKIIVVATSLLILRQTLLSQNMATQMDTVISNCFKHLSPCLNTVQDPAIDEIIETLASAIDKDSSQHMNIKEIMARTLNKSLQEEDPVFTHVSRAVYLALRGVVLGGKGKQGRELAEIALQKAGAALLVDEVVRVGCVLLVVAKVSVVVHGPWYESLIKE